MADAPELLAESGSEQRLHGVDAWTPPETLAERLCARACALALVISVVMIAAEVISRAVFDFSFQVTDEIGGYLLVLVSFLSLPVAQVHQGFHHVEFIQARLTPRGRAISRLIFDLMCLFCAGILLWQLARFEWTTWNSEDVAPTNLATPLWIPRLMMPIGIAVLTATLLRTLVGDVRRIAAAGRHAAAVLPARAR
ncbi:MAG TPA: TRAP transporter small permease [Stellaceae bacterium]|jgi:TRAP-type C4-dicarboxylate transport system permease small subunit|nr:TRAP transporter small permease [Stellaceae bacterium]